MYLTSLPGMAVPSTAINGLLHVSTHVCLFVSRSHRPSWPDAVLTT